jgi:hypothetical protein
VKKECSEPEKLLSAGEVPSAKARLDKEWIERVSDFASRGRSADWAEDACYSSKKHRSCYALADVGMSHTQTAQEVLLRRRRAFWRQRQFRGDGRDLKGGGEESAEVSEELYPGKGGETRKRVVVSDLSPHKVGSSSTGGRARRTSLHSARPAEPSRRPHSLVPSPSAPAPVHTPPHILPS